jgi:hypothetical protein
MKVKQILTICGVAATLCVCVASLQAHQDNGGGNGGGGRRRNQGGGGGGGFGGGGGTFDPAQMQQRRVDNAREELGFTNDTDWSAVEPLVKKVVDAQTQMIGDRMRGFGRNRGGGNGGGGPGGGGGGGRGGFGTPSPEAEALQKAVDDNAPSAQIKAALAKLQTSRKDKQAKLEAAQAELRKVLSVKQEAQATLSGLIQ